MAGDMWGRDAAVATRPSRARVKKKIKRVLGTRQPTAHLRPAVPVLTEHTRGQARGGAPPPTTSTYGFRDTSPAARRVAHQLSPAFDLGLRRRTESAGRIMGPAAEVGTAAALLYPPIGIPVGLGYAARQTIRDARDPGAWAHSLLHPHGLQLGQVEGGRKMPFGFQPRARGDVAQSFRDAAAYAQHRQLPEPSAARRAPRAFGQRHPSGGAGFGFMQNAPTPQPTPRFPQSYKQPKPTATHALHPVAGLQALDKMFTGGIVGQAASIAAHPGRWAEGAFGHAGAFTHPSRYARVHHVMLNAGTVVGPGGRGEIPTRFEVAGTPADWLKMIDRERAHQNVEIPRMPAHEQEAAMLASHGRIAQYLAQHTAAVRRQQRQAALPGRWQSILDQLTAQSGPVSPAELAMRQEQAMMTAAERARAEQGQAATVPGRPARHNFIVQTGGKFNVESPFGPVESPPGGIVHPGAPYATFRQGRAEVPLSRNGVPLHAFNDPPSVERFYSPQVLGDLVRHEQRVSPEPISADEALDHIQKRLSEEWATTSQVVGRPGQPHPGLVREINRTYGEQPSAGSVVQHHTPAGGPVKTYPKAGQTANLRAFSDPFLQGLRNEISQWAPGRRRLKRDQGFTSGLDMRSEALHGLRGDARGHSVISTARDAKTGRLQAVMTTSRQRLGTIAGAKDPLGNVAPFKPRNRVVQLTFDRGQEAAGVRLMIDALKQARKDGVSVTFGTQPAGTSFFMKHSGGRGPLNQPELAGIEVGPLGGPNTFTVRPEQINQLLRDKQRLISFLQRRSGRRARPQGG